MAPYSWSAALGGECIFPSCSASWFGPTIGACVTAGGLAIGGVSGDSLNSAASTVASPASLIGGGSFHSMLAYSLAELAGAVLAAGAFY